jgi:hypothetical protein
MITIGSRSLFGGIGEEFRGSQDSSRLREVAGLDEDIEVDGFADREVTVEDGGKDGTFEGEHGDSGGG